MTRTTPTNRALGTSVAVRPLRHASTDTSTDNEAGTDGTDPLDDTDPSDGTVGPQATDAPDNVPNASGDGLGVVAKVGIGAVILGLLFALIAALRRRTANEE